MFDRLSVGAKLSLAFFSVLLITALLGGVALFRLGRVNDIATDMAADMAPNWLPSSRAAQAVNQEVTRLRTREYRLLLSEGKTRASYSRSPDCRRRFARCILTPSPACGRGRG